MDGTTWPAGVSGADAAWPADGVVVDVNWDYALRNNGTPTDHASRVKLTPIRSLAADAL